MAAKIKGIYKGFKFISQIFAVVKEREMEIGYPTDVKHVAHIGWDGPSGTAPSWMNDFKTPPDFSSTTLTNTGDSNAIATFCTPWSSQDFDRSNGNEAVSINSWSNITPSSDIAKQPKRKKKSSSSPTSLSASSRTSLSLKKP